MKRHVAFLPLVLLVCILALGCEPPPPVASSGPPVPPPPPGSEPPPAVAPASPAPQAPAQPPLPVESKVGVFAGDINDLAGRTTAPVPQPAAAAPAPDANTEVVKAGKGVGIRGRSLDSAGEGAILTPVKAYFAARERAFFDIEFPGNYRTWRAMADGAPKDFEDLKAKFLDPLGLTAKLPKLPDGHKYVWDSAAEQLMVERPKQQ